MNYQDTKIYYTTDGSDPTNQSSIYTTKIKIAGHNTTMIVKAFAIKEQM